MSRDIIKPDIAGLSESSWPGSDALRYFYASAEIAKLGGGYRAKEESSMNPVDYLVCAFPLKCVSSDSR